ncbi:MAG: hypothetical protein ACHQF2_07485 [Flavobacteriales bacterium]
MTKKIYLHGVASGALAAVACVAWCKFYEFAAYVSYPTVFGITELIAIPVAAMILASVVYGWMEKKWKKKGEWIFHFLLTGITLASLIGPIKMHLPDDVEMPEFFPAMVLPMHFFPALAWYTLKPMLNQSTK